MGMYLLIKIHNKKMGCHRYIYCCRYFTVTMLNMFTIHYDSHKIIDFPQTTMARNLLKVEVSFD